MNAPAAMVSESGNITQRVSRLASWLDHQLEHTSTDYESICRETLDRLEAISPGIPIGRTGGDVDAEINIPAAPRRVVPIERVIAEVAAAFGLAPEALRARCKLRAVCHARHVVWYLLRHRLSLGWEQAGAALARHHSSAVYGAQRVAAQLVKHPGGVFAARLARIESDIFAKETA